MNHMVRHMLHAVIAAAIAGGFPAASIAQEQGDRADVIAQVKLIYGLSDEAAVRRLAAEGAAADLYHVVDSGSIQGYAGAWFDPTLEGLVVAVNDGDGFEEARLLGGFPVMVEHSLATLDGVLSRVQSLPLEEGVFRSAYVDFQSNRVVVAVLPGHVGAVQELLSSDIEMITVVGAEEAVQLSANVRGAEGTRNDTWAATYGGVYPCSTGASTETGYFTAGHCGETGDVFRTPSATLLGSMSSSGFMDLFGTDVANVATAVGQTPKPWVNGYSSGQLTVSAKWAGINASPVGTTVCRYGQTSGGPYCGTVNALNQTISVVGYSISGVTRVAGSCSDDGDSGGTWLSSTDYQIQGTTIGATVTNTCPTSTTYTYFQKIASHLAVYSPKVLTAHGAYAPTEASLQCPVASMSGLGTWYCKFSYWNSQGAATFSWSNGSPWPVAGGGFQVRGTCSGGTVNVNLTLTNSYGSYVVPRSFSCPLGPVP